MSGPRYSILPPAVFTDERVPHLGLKMLGVLGSHTDQRGWCAVNQRKLAERLGVTRETTCRCIKKMVELGYIEKLDQFGKNGRRNISAYRVVIDRPGEEPPEIEIDPEEAGEDPTEGVCDAMDVTTVVNPMDVTTKRPSFKRPSLSNDKDAERDQGKEFWNRSLGKLACVDPQKNNISKHRALIGKWVKAANKDFPALLAILDACEKAGTHDPVSYISAAVRDKFPPPEKREDPKDIPESKWIIIRGVAIERREWAEAWGPPPGSKGCVMPKDLITPELLSVFKPEGAML